MGTLRGAATSWRTRSTSSKRVEGRPLASDKGETALLSAAALGGSTARRSLSSPLEQSLVRDQCCVYSP